MDNCSNVKIKVYKSILSNSDIKFAIEQVDHFDRTGDLLQFKDNPYVLIAPETRRINFLLRKYSELACQVHKADNGFLPDLYTTEAYLNLWNPGAYASAHVDSHAEYEFLLYTTLFYLNDEYEGGEICFPNQGVVYKPKAGDVIFFPCGGTEHPHSVNQIISGRRYTIAMWHSMRHDKRSRSLYDIRTPIPEVIE